MEDMLDGSESLTARGWGSFAMLGRPDWLFLRELIMRVKDAYVSTMRENDLVLTGDHLGLTPDVGIDPVRREVHGLIGIMTSAEDDWNSASGTRKSSRSSACRSPDGS